MDRQALWLTVRLAAATTAVLMAVALPLAWWIAAQSSSRAGGALRALVQALVALPLVLPPTVLGFYLLIEMGPLTGPGRAAAHLLGHPLAFSFEGLLAGSILYSLPFAVQPLVAGFRALERGMLEAAAGLGASPWRVFRTIALPLASPAVITSAVLTFTHTVGEFGVVLMIGGNIPGSTRTLSIALFDLVEDGRYTSAHQVALVLAGIATAALLAIYLRPELLFAGSVRPAEAGR